MAQLSLIPSSSLSQRTAIEGELGASTSSANEESSGKLSLPQSLDPVSHADEEQCGGRSATWRVSDRRHKLPNQLRLNFAQS